MSVFSIVIKISDLHKVSTSNAYEFKFYGAAYTTRFSKVCVIWSYSLVLESINSQLQIVRDNIITCQPMFEWRQQ